MPQRRQHIAPSAAQSELAAALTTLRENPDLPGAFSPAALAEAESATNSLPGIDLRHLPFVTLDPVGSMDLDQAFHLERLDSGFLVRYAIADVPGFVTPGGAIDSEARRRGQTLYAADGRIPLHPTALSEQRASLLPNVDRPALVWTFHLDSAGAVTEFDLTRAQIRSRAQLDYVSTQQALDRGDPSPADLLRVIGMLRQEQERLRGGASLNMPDEEVVQRDDGTYDIERRNPLPIEEWNAQLSLMTGMAAAELMLAAGVGVLRVMPVPDASAFAAFRRQTTILGRPWSTGTYGEYLHDLDRADPLTLPIIQAAAALFRGAGYVVFDGDVPAETIQAAIAAPYAHATAPLRRLVDRWVLTICLAEATGTEIPSWVRESLTLLPEAMRASSQRASQLERDTVDRVEAALLAPRVGTTLDARVIELRDNGRARIQLTDPAVTANVAVPDGINAGDSLAVTLARADIAAGITEFSFKNEN